MAQRYCTNCGAELLEEARFCGGCGRPAHQTAAVATPEANVGVPPPPRRGFWDEEPRRRPVRSARDKTEYLLWGFVALVVLVVVALILAIGSGILLGLLGYSAGESGRMVGGAIAWILPYLFWGVLGVAGLCIGISVVFNVVRHARALRR